MSNSDEYMELVSAVREPTYELFCTALARARNINATTKHGKSNILHFVIREMETERLRVEDLERLLALGADVNWRNHGGHTPLHYTVTIRYSAQLASTLLRYGAIVDSADNDGNTPLWRAVMEYRGEDELLRIIFLLLEYRADLDRKNAHGRSARDVIARRDQSIAEGGAEPHWGLSDHLATYLAKTP